MAQVLPAERDLRRVIGDGEAVPDGEVEGLEERDLLELYRWMILLRTYDERSVVYHSQGRIGTYAIFWNHEAMQAGSAYALEREDWIFPSYRESAIGLLRGMPASTVLSWWRGQPAGAWAPAELNVASSCVPIATHLPHAVGLSWAAKIKNDPIASLAWFGDGATSEGDFHEAMNFASVHRLPVIFFCQNNGYAISERIDRQMAVRSVADRAAAYGIPGVSVDGNDALAVLAATREAAERARHGEGPTLLEARTYRLVPHTSDDDDRVYRSREEVEEWRRRDPLDRLRRYLEEHRLLDGAADEELRREVVTAVETATASAEAAPVPDPGTLARHVYAEPR